MRVIRKFVNEIGNDIEVLVGTDDARPRVIVQMTGPKSRSRNIITRKEAEQLHSALSEALSPPEINAFRAGDRK